IFPGKNRKTASGSGAMGADRQHPACG
ncbi:host specificity protein, partial [Escherichia coli]|nr:host specificity protein [Escherichia coli]EFI3735516.1 host specificity protein [Escherichia coli]EFI3876898.1 host specificity protein [Escherichia coli]EFI4456871.1 host specificity protein [Escherichia coli]EFI8848572.1 host specificity protein [Escherichia coli]